MEIRFEVISFILLENCCYEYILLLIGSSYRGEMSVYV